MVEEYFPLIFIVFVGIVYVVCMYCYVKKNPEVLNDKDDFSPPPAF